MADGLAGLAAAIRTVADRAQAGLALEACRMGAREYLFELEVVTPVLSGALRASERVWRVTGNGEAAVGVVGPDIIYGRFRNYGGTITSKGPWPLRNRATGQVFGRSVTQQGSHYMERSEPPGQVALTRACKVIADEMLTLP